ncbi:hypothetical protein [Halomonas tibetensis]|uniref:Uncharacterized protein n=1 Tax=Halomonas tibetensis TaxID=2259590 RepID=A0ABV7B1K1_9GAMM
MNASKILEQLMRQASGQSGSANGRGGNLPAEVATELEHQARDAG